MSQFAKAAIALVCILVAIRVALYLVQVLWIFALVLFPVVLLIGALFAVGYMAPADMRAAAEKEIRDWLDWLKSVSPSWTWPVIGFARGGLDWLGLHVRVK